MLYHSSSPLFIPDCDTASTRSQSGRTPHRNWSRPRVDLDDLELGYFALQYLDESYLEFEAVDQHGMDEIQIDGWMDGLLYAAFRWDMGGWHAELKGCLCM